MSDLLSSTSLPPAGPADETLDREWAELLSPNRRQWIRGTGLAVGALALSGLAAARAEAQCADGGLPDAGKNFAEPKHKPGESPWGYETYKAPTPRPASILPGPANGLPERPQAYTAIKSYHAHIYFNEDSYEKAALLRKWSAERFLVELGDWNLKPRGPHVTPSFYFGFSNELFPKVVPWLQLNNLGLTILLHPNSEDPRSDHLYYALWINRTQPVNAFDWPTLEQRKKKGDLSVEQIYPNTKPSVTLET